MLTKQDLAAIDQLMAARFTAMKQELKAEIMAELEVWQQHIIDTLAEMIGGLIAYMDERFDEIFRRLDSHEYRITTLEARATG